MFKNKRTVAIQVISLAAAVLLLFTVLPFFAVGADAQKTGATGATAEKSAAQPVRAGNTVPIDYAAPIGTNTRKDTDAEKGATENKTESGAEKSTAAENDTAEKKDATGENGKAQPANAGDTAISGAVGALSDCCGSTEDNAGKGEKKSAAAKRDATDEENKTHPASTGNIAIHGTAAQTENTAAKESAPPNAVSEVFSDSAVSVGWQEGVAVTDTASPLSHFADGNAAELPFFSANELKKADPSVKTERLYGITPVIFVKNGNGGQQISWQDVFSGRYTVCFPALPNRAAVILLAASYAVTGSADSTDIISEKLSLIAEAGRLTTVPNEADIIADLDFSQHSGFTPVIPADGTASFSLYLVSVEPFSVTAADRKYFSLRGAEKAASLSGGKITNAEEVPGSWQKSYSALLPVARYRITSHSRSFLGSNGYNAVTVVCFFLLIFLCGSIAKRSMQKTFSVSIVSTGVLISLWVAVRFIKWQTDEVYTVNRYLWYSFYLFFIALPLLILLMASKVGVRDDDGKPPRFWYAFAAVGAVLLAFVITNDLHGLVFKIESGSNYSYGALYFAAASFIGVTFFAALAILYKKCLSSVYKPSIIYPVLLSAIPFVYWILFVNRVGAAAQMDVTLAASFFTVFTYEAVLRTGLVPCNVKYRRLFRYSHLGMQIVGSGGAVQYSSAFFTPLSKNDFTAMCMGESSRLAENDSNMRISRSVIPGGFVIREEDISALNADRQKLTRAVRALADSNSVLERRERIAAQKASESIKKQLYAELDDNLKEKLEDVRFMAANLPDEISDGNSYEYRLILGAVGFTLCYIKRRCSFLFKRLQGDMLPSADIVTCVSELCEAGRNAGVKCVAYQSIDGDISPADCETIYDFCFSVLEYAAKNDCAEIILRFFRSGNDIVMSFIGSGALSGYKAPENITAPNARITPKDLEEAYSITLTVSHGNGECGKKGGAV